jgi:NAD(P)-dependent dehydrogenase (short-subunit alcohol dehydrogenase family)
LAPITASARLPFCRSLAPTPTSQPVEWAHVGIRTNAIAPGSINVAETPDEEAHYAARDGSAAPLIVA